jgi:predicted RNase H-like nuclease
MIHKKSTLAGFQERLQVLRPLFPAADSLVESALSSYLRKEVAKDDILDALVCAVVATRSQQWVSVPAAPELDSHGIPMEMVYAEVN